MYSEKADVTSPLKFSIVIPTRNGERYIETTVESVLSQTYPHFELIILESGSEDSTCSILADFDDPRIKVLSTRAVLSIWDNWARILDLELAEYMTILGHDDVLYPDYLAEIAQLIEVEPGASVYTTHFDWIDPAGEKIRSSQPVPYQETADNFFLSFHQLKRDSYGTGYVIRSGDYKLLGGFPPFPGLMYADDITWYRLISLTHKVCSPRSLFACRLHPESAGHIVSLYDLFLASKQYWRALEQSDYFQKKEHVSAARKYIEYTFNGKYHKILAGLIASDGIEERREYQRVKARILAEHAEEPLFTVFDTTSSIYEVIAFMKWRPLRRFLFIFIKAFRVIRQSQRDRGLAN